MLQRYLSLPAICLLLFTALFRQNATAQLFSEVDSLRFELAKSQPDTNRVNLYRRIAIALEYTYPDSAMVYAQQGLRLAEKLDFPKGKAQALNEIGSVLFLTGNYSAALEIYLRSLVIREEIGNPQGIAVALDNIGQLYHEQSDYRHALQYYFRAIELDKKADSDFGYMLDCNFIGDAYERMGMLDSALFYQQTAYHKAVESKDPEYTGPILTSMGNIHSGLGNYDLAISYYRASLPFAESASDLQNFSESYLGFARLYAKMHVTDSVIHYAKKAIQSASRDYPKAVLKASMLLSDSYETKMQNDSAVKYLHLAIAVNDTLFNQEKIRQVQTLTLNEQLRQQEKKDEKEEAERMRRFNLQNFGIAIFIITFFSFLMVLRRRNISKKMVEFLGLLGMLLLFEFISMFVYPWISEKAHDIPVIVLIGSVIAGSILVFLHKKVENWLHRKLFYRQTP